MAQIDDMEAALSLERFARYVTWAGNDRERAQHAVEKTRQWPVEETQ